MSYGQDCQQCGMVESLAVVLPTWYMLRTGDDVKWFCCLHCLYEHVRSVLITTNSPPITT